MGTSRSRNLSGETQLYFGENLYINLTWAAEPNIAIWLSFIIVISSFQQVSSFLHSFGTSLLCCSYWTVSTFCGPFALCAGKIIIFLDMGTSFFITVPRSIIIVSSVQVLRLYGFLIALPGILCRRQQRKAEYSMLPSSFNAACLSLRLHFVLNEYLGIGSWITLCPLYICVSFIERCKW